MNIHKKLNYKEKVLKVSNDLLEQNGSINVIDTLNRMGWLDSTHIYSWQDGIEPNLEQFMQSTPEKRAKLYATFSQWSKNLAFIDSPWMCYSLIGEDKILKVLEADCPETEKLFNRHFYKKDLTSRKLKSLIQKLNKKPDTRVFVKTGKNEDSCRKCEKNLIKSSFIYVEAQTVYCLRCVGLAQLTFQPSGDATLSRRAKKFTSTFAEVVEFNKRRKRYERRGILVEEKALKMARQSCESDAEDREIKRVKNAKKRVMEDKNFTREFTFKVKQLFPNCPNDEVVAIAEHATLRGSGRVGRTAAAKKLNDDSVRLAVIAYIRHKHTDYDRLLFNRTPKKTCRRLIQPALQKKLKSWEA